MKWITVAALVPVFAGCGSSTSQQPEQRASAAPEHEAPPSLFRLVPPESSGVRFANTIRETAEGNFSLFDYMYNGNGVAIGDINGDSLPDLYITGNQQNDRLYLNKGGLRFEDITERAGIRNAEGWKTGVCMVDIDADGDLDIHVCRSGWHADPEIRRNLLYINNGDLTFTESAKQWGIDDPGHSVQAAFSDLDGDGDLDMYLMNHPVDFDQTLEDRLERMKDPDPMITDRLYRNDGDHFTDVSLAAGIREYGHGLGLSIWDVNGDGREDIYVANDFQSRDYLWMNKGGMKFKDELTDHFPHVSYFSMGCDVADFDNDLDDDLFVVEMLPWERKREVMNLADMDEMRYQRFLESGFHHQYMRNVFQMDEGGGRFSDIAWISGTAATDWSWAALFADLDNDGWKDLLVTNGYLRDTQDRDFKKKEKPFIESRKGGVTMADLATICHSVKIPNRVFHNLGNGGVRFEEVGAQWGLKEKAFSYGAAYADLDRDGDLDLVIANTTLTLAPDPAFVYENLATQENHNHWLRVRLRGNTRNTYGEGAIVRIAAPSGPQEQTLRFTRGFQSSVEPILHFGLGADAAVEGLVVHWPNGTMQTLKRLKADREIVLDQSQAIDANYDGREERDTHMLERMGTAGLTFDHQESPFDDYAAQWQLPERLSYGGPCMAGADVNGDGREDVFIGGAKDQPGAIFMAAGPRGWKPVFRPFADGEKAFEDRACAFLDADGDGDQDLCVGSGSTEFKDPAMLQARLYLNHGGGSFVRAGDALPGVILNAGAVATADVDDDGRMDLFIGGRSMPGAYPSIPRSYLLHNDGGTFSDATASLAPDLVQPGMITAAAFADIDRDGDADLVVAGDWMKVRAFRNDHGHFIEATGEWIPGSLTGWWRSLAIGDLDDDGDLDMVVGNYGLNHRYRPTVEHPLLMLGNDFDHNGSQDIVLARWIEGAYRPDRSFTYLRHQFPFLDLKFDRYEDFAAADLVRVFGVDVEKATRSTTESFASMLFINEGGRFVPRPLPDLAQLSSINAIVIQDVDGDGAPEIITAGNTFRGPVEIDSDDAGIGAVLQRNADGSWRVLPSKESGFEEPGMVRSLIVANGHLVVGNNDGPLHLYDMPGAPVP